MKTCHSQKRSRVDRKKYAHIHIQPFFFPFSLLHLNPAVPVTDFIKPEAVYAFLT